MTRQPDEQYCTRWGEATEEAAVRCLACGVPSEAPTRPSAIYLSAPVKQPTEQTNNAPPLERTLLLGLW